MTFIIIAFTSCAIYHRKNGLSVFACSFIFICIYACNTSFIDKDNTFAILTFDSASFTRFPNDCALNWNLCESYPTYARY